MTYIESICKAPDWFKICCSIASHYEALEKGRGNLGLLKPRINLIGCQPQAQLRDGQGQQSQTLHSQITIGNNQKTEPMLAQSSPLLFVPNYSPLSVKNYFCHFDKIMQKCNVSPRPPSCRCESRFDIRDPMLLAAITSLISLSHELAPEGLFEESLIPRLKTQDARLKTGHRT